MADESDRDDGKRFSAKVTGRHAITLPAEFCRALRIQVGDIVEIELHGDHASLRRRTSRDLPSARGILGGHFSSLDDIDRYVEAERQGWDEREGLQNDRATSGARDEQRSRCRGRPPCLPAPPNRRVSGFTHVS
jgi:bifunctional DNA-binding transcriptional regulator/antitoxin component of YhaV-PrlF toxin-antitoxin module